MNLPIVDVEIGERTLVPCASVRYSMVDAKKCIDCECFQGIGQKTESTHVEIKHPVTGDVVELRPILWAEKYAIRCNATVEYSCQAY